LFLIVLIVKKRLDFQHVTCSVTVLSTDMNSGPFEERQFVDERELRIILLHIEKVSNIYDIAI